MLCTRLALALFATSTFMCFSQSSSLARWQFKASTISPHEAELVATVRIPSGWHLYSQHLGDGGPIPTRFTFQPSAEYTLKDSMVEHGDAVTFYDKMYDMEITWYAGTVSFSQSIYLHQQSATIQGEVEYMLCNTQSCQPFREKIFFFAGGKK